MDSGSYLPGSTNSKEVWMIDFLYILGYLILAGIVIVTLSKEG